MKRPSALFVALLTPVLLAWSVGVEAQSCSNGRAIYTRAVAGVPISCSQDSCHKPNPSPTQNANNIMKGAANAGAIDNALNTVNDMSGVRAGLGLTLSDLDDIAHYLFYRSGNQNCPANAPILTPSPASLDFGNVTVGATSATQSVTITNTGSANAPSLSRVNSNSEFIASGTCTTVGSLAVNASCTLTIAYNPNGAGADNATWTLTSGSVNAVVGLSGTGVTAANLSASPPSASFGSVTVGQTSSTTQFTITNNGGTGATGVGFVNNNTLEFPVSGNSCGSTLAAGASCSLNVAYKPSGAGGDSATLTVNYAGGSPVVINMNGIGTTPANLAASPPSLSFGNVTVGAPGAKQTITVSNSGSNAASGVGVASSNPAEFVVGANSCVGTLAGNASCSLDVTYTPSGTGADTATLTISYAGGSNVVVSMTGTGSAAPVANLQLSPALATFGSVTVGLPSATKPFTLSNTGNAGAAAIAFANSNAAEFMVSSNTCGATLAAGANCSFNVTYSPTAMGADNATLTISYTGGASLVLAMSGTGVASAPPPAGQLSLPVSVTLPSQIVGTTGAPFAVQISNTGNAAVVVSAINLTNTAEFALASSTCANVAASSACTLSFTFTPSATGARSTSVSIVSDGTGSPQVLVVQGTGLTPGGTPPPTGGTAQAIEYYHAAFDHYFITAIADEITKLDNGTFKGWARTGHSFKVYPNVAADLNPVCRFFSTAFGAKSSHFYTPFPAECTTVKANPNWMFEAEVFYVPVPTFDGACAAGTAPVYRMYNNGQSGAPNHRYTTDLAVRQQMLDKGWIAEGAGTIGVILCTPQ